MSGASRGSCPAGRDTRPANYHPSMEEHTLTSRRIYEGKIIALRVDEVERDDGHRSERAIIEHRGAVAILAWDGERLAFVRQWRHAVGAALLELPAGTLDPGEEPLETARRELAEESGLAAEEWEAGPRFYTAPGFCDEEMRLFLATGLREVAAAAPDDEAIDREWLELADALAAIEDGRLADAKSIVGVLWLARRLGR
jgi:ADP-ribose pyrophosphatase